MASALFKPSRILAVALLLGAGAWIGSGYLAPHADEPGPSPVVAATAVPLQKVGVEAVAPERRERVVLLSAVTEADQRGSAVARAAGTIVTLEVDRGSAVRAGDTIATISDEGREASVKQAEALLEQRRAEHEATKRLVERGNAPRNQLAVLEAQVASAEAALAAAKAEWDRMSVKSPVDGLVDSVPVQVGQAVQPGTEIAEVIGPDPMLAVGSVTEKERGALQIGQNATVRFIDGTTVTGTVGFVSLTADKATRTYRVEVRMVNPDAAIADGVSCEIAISLAPVEATPIPRSALVFSDDGKLGVRTVDAQSIAHFRPVAIVDDERSTVWVTGLEGETRVITLGQDFVKDGDPVEAVSSTAITAGPEPRA